MSVFYKGKEISSIVFDFDKTLYSADETLEEAIWGEARRKIVSMILEKEGVLNPSTETLENRLAAYLVEAKRIGWREAALAAGVNNEDFTKAITTVSKAEFLEYSPELVSLLQFLLDQVRLYIFTGSSRDSVLASLKVLIGELAKHFEDRLLAVDDMQSGQKPSKEAYLELVEKFQLEPEKTIFIDDRLEEVSTAMKLGMITFWIGGQENVTAHVAIKTVLELTDHLEVW